jgi:uncharacterized protein YceH (UPF0502 family)
VAGGIEAYVRLTGCRYTAAMMETLSEIERRVLGVLLEKALAQPQYYPMTTNAIVAACNQKSNRDPIMELDEEAVWNALEVLRAAGLVSRLMPGGASRVERFKHEAKELLGWEKPQRAVMAELLLRGPQTVGELRGRCGRLYAFENTEAVSAVLESLAQMTPARVALLPRAPGQSAPRYAHRLYPPGEWAQLTAGGAETPGPMSAGPATQIVAAASGVDTGAWREELEALQGEVAELHQELAELRQRLARLEGGA